MSGGSSGGGRRGGNAGIDEVAATVGRDFWQMMHMRDPGGAFVANTTRVRWWGVNSFTGGSVHNAGCTGACTQWVNITSAFPDTTFAIPHWFPRAGTIKRLSFFCARASQSGLGRLQLCIFSSGVATLPAIVGAPYPDQLLAAGSVIEPGNAAHVINLHASGTWGISDHLVDYHVDDQTLLWGVIRCNQFGQAGTRMGLHRHVFPPWIGQTIGSGVIATDAATAGCGWKHEQVWSITPPNTFPQTAPTVIPCTTDNFDVPAIGFGFDED
jgi:hypothetical protein